MIVRRFAPRQAARRLLFAQTSQPRRRRLATQLPAGPVSALDNGSHAPARSFEDLDPAFAQMRKDAQPQETDPQNDLSIETFHTGNHIRHTTGHYGSVTTPHYQPMDLITNPPSPSNISLELLLASQTHLGHSTSLWNPSNARYIFGIREGVHIISLDITAAYLRRAARVVTNVGERGGIILFAGTRRGHDRCVVRAAELAGACHLFERWTPGSITNGQQILGRCQMKVVDENDTEVIGFDDQLLDRAVLKPDLVICLNPLENYIMLHECGLAGIPTIGIIDTDANPTWVTYPIPANDDSLRSVSVIAGILGRAGEEGFQRRLALTKSGKRSETRLAEGTSGWGPDGTVDKEIETAHVDHNQNSDDLATSENGLSLDANEGRSANQRMLQDVGSEENDVLDEQAVNGQPALSPGNADASIVDQASSGRPQARRNLDKDDEEMQRGRSNV